MQVFKDYQGRDIRLPDERLNHIHTAHYEMIGMEEAIPETLSDPDLVFESNADVTVHVYYRFYYGTRFGDKYVRVVVKMLENDAFVLTAHIRDEIREATELWRRNR